MPDKPKRMLVGDPDLVAEAKISEIMKGLDDSDKAAVICWFRRKYGPEPMPKPEAS